VRSCRVGAAQAGGHGPCSCPEPPRDPAGRVIVATGRILGPVLPTQDARLLAYPHVRTLW